MASQRDLAETDEPVALAFEDRRYSLRELDALAGGLAGTLAGRGVRAGDRVALMSSNRPEFVVAVRAIWRLGAAVVLLSPAWKRGEVEHALAVTAPAHAVGDHPVLADLMPTTSLDDPIHPAADSPTPPPKAEPGTPAAPKAVLSTEPGTPAAPKAALSTEPGTPAARDTDLSTEPEADPGADLVLVFSSGTTGMPKAVRHTRASFAAAVRHWRDALGLTEKDRIQIATPPSHILGLLNLVTALETGALVRLHRRFDLDRLLQHIESDRITVEMAVAPIALAIASHPMLESYDLSSLRYIMWGATPVTPSVAATVTRRTGVGWLPAYGASELPVISCNPLDDARLDSAGRPVPGVRVRVMSPATGEPVGPGETGEIQARSASLMAGYLPAGATAEAFVDGWYRTGDIGHLDADGWLRITDRSKEMIKVRGFQVAPAEVETALLGHPAVADCAVFGIPDAADGEAVVAAVATTAPVPPAELIALVGERLASYKKPREIVFVAEIPRLPSGKVLRRVLKERHGCASDA